METNRPMPGEKWHLKSDPKKVLTVAWCNSCDYVQFHAPWMKQCQRHNVGPHPSFYAGAQLKTFLNRYMKHID
jgi:hypothetical protein